jgi:hypothetical protein
MPFLDAVRDGPGPARVMAAQWRASALVEVVRQSPALGPSGKVLHLHHGAGREGGGTPALSRVRTS